MATGLAPRPPQPGGVFPQGQTPVLVGHGAFDVVLGPRRRGVTVPLRPRHVKVGHKVGDATEDTAPLRPEETGPHTPATGLPRLADVVVDIAPGQATRLGPRDGPVVPRAVAVVTIGLVPHVVEVPSVVPAVPDATRTGHTVGPVFPDIGRL